jgi:hypothetical protein
VRAQEQMRAWKALNCDSPTVLHPAGSDGLGVVPPPFGCKRRIPAKPGEPARENRTAEQSPKSQCANRRERFASAVSGLIGPVRADDDE